MKTSHWSSIGFGRLVCVAITATAFGLGGAVQAQSTDASDILINEIDADNPGTDSAEFVELYDGGVGNTALDGLVVVFYNGSNDQSYAAFDLDGTVTSAEGYYVLGNAGVANVSLTFGGNGLQNGQDAVALYRGDADDFPSSTPVTTANLVDAVVYGTGDADDNGLAVLLDEGQAQLDEDANGNKDDESLQRSPDGAGDARQTESFVAGTPTPGTENGVAVAPGPGMGDGIPTGAMTGLRIPAIQGAAQVSPYDGTAVAGVPGVITAFTDNGLYMQDPDGDGLTATSDAIFVFTGGAPDQDFDGSSLAEGDIVIVAGTVTEFVPGGTSSNNLPTTEIAIGNDGSVRRAANPDELFENIEIIPTVIGMSGRRPPTDIIDNDTDGDITTSANTAFDPDEDGIDFYESLEGMRVTVNNAVAVAPTNDFGEIFVVPDSASNATGINARGGITLVTRAAGVDYNPERIQIDPIDDAPEVSVGAVFSTVTGVLGYGFGNFEIVTDRLAEPQPSPLRREAIGVLARGDTLTLAGYNVENLDPNDDDEDRGEPDTDVADGKFAAIAKQIVDNLGAPDIVALQEVQDNDGSDGASVPEDGTIDDLVVDGDQTLRMLTDAIVSAGGPRYASTEIAPMALADGGQPGGNIRVAYLYDPTRVSLVPGSQGKGDATSATQVTSDADGQLQLTLNPGRIEPGNPAFDNSRKSLAALFEFRGQRVLIVNNHFSSKGGSSPLFGAEQPYINGSADQREAQAAVINAFVDRTRSAVADAHIALIGDFNEFSFLEPLRVLTGAADGEPVVADLLDQLDPVERYTYVFEGNSQALDHLFATPNLAARASVDVLHVNSQFVDQVSDHDPIVAQFDLAADMTDTPDGGGGDPSPVAESDDGLAVGGDGGGCTMGNGRDASLPILLLLATIILARRRRARV